MDTELQTMFPSESRFTGIHIYTVLYVIIAVIAVIGLYYIYTQLYTRSSKTEQSLVTNDIPVQPIIPEVVEKETWCFVGEDLSGRYCVRVPSEKSCVPERAFYSRNECELTPASHMPAGIQTGGGSGLVPLGSLSLQ